jgi:thioredoxin reductase (NADPH)
MPLETIVVSEENLYDVIIVGSGPAGLTAAKLCAENKLKTCFIERGAPGGKITSLTHINNYPPENGISGSVLSKSLFNAAIDANAKYLFGNVINVSTKLGYVVIQAQNGQT